MRAASASAFSAAACITTVLRPYISILKVAPMAGAERSTCSKASPPNRGTITKRKSGVVKIRIKPADAPDPADGRGECALADATFWLYRPVRRRLQSAIPAHDTDSAAARFAVSGNGVRLPGPAMFAVGRRGPCPSGDALVRVSCRVRPALQ